MDNVEQLFRISFEQEMGDVFYFQEISQHKSEMVHKVPWGGALLRNCLPSGDLLRFKTVKEYDDFKKKSNQSLWLLLPLKVFRHSDTLYGVYCCP